MVTTLVSASDGPLAICVDLYDDICVFIAYKYTFIVGNKSTINGGKNLADIFSCGSATIYSHKYCSAKDRYF